jgi:hypothetical protein
LPIECPPAWQARPEVTPHPRREHRVTNAEFAKLRAELEPDIGPLPPAVGALEPGDRFQPLLLRVPSRPTADFLWPGVGDLLASDRVRALWREPCAVPRLWLTPPACPDTGTSPSPGRPHGWFMRCCSVVGMAFNDTQPCVPRRIVLATIGQHCHSTALPHAPAGAPPGNFG